VSEYLAQGCNACPSSDQAGSRTRYLRVASPARYPVDHCAFSTDKTVSIVPEFQKRRIDDVTIEQATSDFLSTQRSLSSDNIITSEQIGLKRAANCAFWKGAKFNKVVGLTYSDHISSYIRHYDFL
jgi:hypothetical protein